MKLGFHTYNFDLIKIFVNHNLKGINTMVFGEFQFVIITKPQFTTDILYETCQQLISCIKIEIRHMKNLTVLRRQNLRILSSIIFREILEKEWAIMIILFIHSSIEWLCCARHCTRHWRNRTEQRNSSLKRNLLSTGRRLTINDTFR